jgi:diacylglycerol kinase family enzyme
MLAAAVGFTRIYTGAHYTSDVLAGAALGAGVATLGAVIVPGHDEPQRAGREPARPQPVRTDGKGLVAVVNPSSGTAGDGLLDTLAGELPAAEILQAADGDDLRTMLRTAAARADVLGVAGGDGTINCAALAAIEADVPLLVFPGGTFNHFARDLDLCTAADSIAALRAGRAVRIDVGDANGEIFLNTASLGSYPEFVRIRESLEHRLGKRFAAAVAIVRVVRSGPGIEAVIEGRPAHLALLFVGNGRYRPNGFVPRWRPALDTGCLDVRWVDGSRRGSLISLLLAALTANAYRPASYRSRAAQELHVDVRGERGLLARDGEVHDAPTPVRFSVRRQALTVYRGEPSGGAAAGTGAAGAAAPGS